MLNERALYLINGDIDGELGAEERVELDGLLTASAEARTLRAELLRLTTLISSVPERIPPADLTDRIISQIRLPTVAPKRSLTDLFRPFQPGPAGLAFAAGLLMTVTYYELSESKRQAVDLSNMVGTMVANPMGRATQPVDSLVIEALGVSGQVELSENGSLLVLAFDLESTQATEIDIALTESGLGFGGIAHTNPGEVLVNESYEVSGGTLRVVNQGRQAFSVFLLRAADGKGSGRNISIGISTGGTRVYDGVLRG